MKSGLPGCSAHSRGANMIRLYKVVLFVACLAVVGAAAAQAWPARPLRFIVSQPPGTGPDIIARLLADNLTKRWGQQVVIDNRPGGASIIGVTAAARSPADGYNFLFTTGGILLNVYTFKALPYDIERDFIPVALIGRAPFVLAVNNALPANSVGELVALMKAQPGKLSFASDGPKGLSGMPYNGTTPAIQDTIAGRTQFLFSSTPPIDPFIKSGKLRALALTTTGHVPGYDKLPRLKETFPEFEYMGWYMLYAPAGTSQDVVRRINRDMGEMLKEPAIAKRLLEFGSVVEEVGTPDSLKEFHAIEHERWRKLVQLTGLRPE
jgi:tripartite-type tricarboxylate transporter receptor subunit TctC